MSQYQHHQRLSLNNFTAFREVEFEFVPGVNVFVGENGTGKTHAMKILYAMQLNYAREHLSKFGDLLEGIFQAQDFWQLMRQQDKPGQSELGWTYNDRSTSRTIHPTSIYNNSPATQDERRKDQSSSRPLI